jgi:hypothetical protein
MTEQILAMTALLIKQNVGCLMSSLTGKVERKSGNIKNGFFD